MRMEHACRRDFSCHFARTAILVARTIALFAGLMLLPASFVDAATWCVSSGDWSNPESWGGVLPTSSESALINNGGAVTISQPDAMAGTLQIGDSGGIGTVNMVGGSLDTGGTYLGSDYWQEGGVVFNQTGGTHTIGDMLVVVYSSHYSLSGSATLTCGRVYLDAFGTFAQNGGSNAISSDLSINNGSYSLSGSGTLVATREYVGNGVAGVYTQTGGSNTAEYVEIRAAGTCTARGGTLNVNDALVNQGVLDLSNSTATLNIVGGIDNQGTINMAGSSATLSLSYAIANLSAASLGDSHLSVALDAHSLLIVPREFDTGTFANCTNDGIIHHAGSSLSITSDRRIYGIGAINDHVNCTGRLAARSGYTLNLNGGVNVSAGGNVNLKNGSLYVHDAISGLDQGFLAAANEYVGAGGAGVFTQTSGTNSLAKLNGNYEYGVLYLGYNAPGTYNLSGNGVLTTGFVNIGCNASGSFVQSGGSVSTAAWDWWGSATDYIDVGHGGVGSYCLSGGAISTGMERVGVNSRGTFAQTGGTNSMHSGVYAGISLVIGYSGSQGTYSLAGEGVLSASGAEDIVNGSFTQSGGTNSAAALCVGGTYMYPGSVGADCSYLLSGKGVLNTSRESIGSGGGVNTFAQTGGVHTVAGDLLVAEGANGVFTFSGTSTLSVRGDEYVGYGSTYNISGSFAQTGGTHTVASSLYVGYQVGGTFNLSGAASLTANNEYIGYFDAFDDGVEGTFIQTGGSHTVVDSLYLGYSRPSVGGYQLSGSGRLAAVNEYIGYGDIGTVTQTGGTNTVSGSLVLGCNPESKGTYNLNGGLLAVRALAAGLGVAELKFGGGSLRADASFTTTVPIELTGTGGTANIDTQGHVVTLAGALFGAGGLTKSGDGTLILAASNELGGVMTVNAGVVVAVTPTALPPSGSLGTMTVASGAAIGGFVANSGHWNESDFAGLLTRVNWAPCAALAIDTTPGSYVYNSVIGDGGTAGSVSIGVTKLGAGKLTLSAANSYTGLTTVKNGTLQLAPAAQNMVLTLGGAELQAHDLGGGRIEASKLVFDYAGAANPAVTINALLTASCDGGTWDVGKFLSPTAAALGLTLGWLDDPVMQTVTVMATYPGDFNLDGVVNATDMDIIVSHIGRSGDWGDGDVNYDGLIDILDWNAWKASRGLPPLGDGSLAQVPEPGTFALMAVGLLGLFVCSRRCRAGSAAR
jgi:fibronectin-binding autotransporter adhesin